LFLLRLLRSPKAWKILPANVRTCVVEPIHLSSR
jgi:hypothetical protein